MSRQFNTRNSSTQQAAGSRSKMLAKIHIEFQQMRPDLRHSAEELRLERLAFCEKVLNLRKTLDSMRRLSNAQLGRIIEAIKSEKPQGHLYGCGVHHFQRKPHGLEVMTHTGAEIHHLAGKEQVWAIERVFRYLRWPTKGREKFLKDKFKRLTPTLLTPKQANACLIILFTIAITRDLKLELGQKAIVTRQMIAKRIHELKRKLGIDQGVA